MRHSLISPLLLAVSLLACAQPRDVTSLPRRDPVYAGLVGKWQGTLEERDVARPFASKSPGGRVCWCRAVPGLIFASTCASPPATGRRVETGDD